MKQRIERRLELTPDDVKALTINGLRNTKDMPPPAIDLAAIKFKLTKNGATVSWTEEGEQA